jgi:hypothetical protein
MAVGMKPHTWDRAASPEQGVAPGRMINAAHCAALGSLMRRSVLAERPESGQAAPVLSGDTPEMERPKRSFAQRLPARDELLYFLAAHQLRN